MEAQVHKDKRTAPASAPTQQIATPWWVSAIVILGAALLIAGACIALFRPRMLSSPYQEINGAARIYAGYLVSRNLAIGLLLLAALALRARGVLAGLMTLYAFIQFLDVAIDCAEHRFAIVPGIFVLAVLFLISAARISGHPFWSTRAWRETT